MGRLVVAFDIGVTFSKASYAFLGPIPEVRVMAVTQFPGQQHIGGNSKVPTVVCYDEDGRVVAAGSEADLDDNPELAEVSGLSRAEWFKFHLCPHRLPDGQEFDMTFLPPLPMNKSVIDVFGDFLRYLSDAVKSFITHRHGADLWDSSIHFILSYPNGWDEDQQMGMRRAAILAGLVASACEALERVSFVAEGEAILDYCLNQIPRLQSLRSEGVLVADCGKGTTNVSTYCRSLGGLSWKETSPTKCLLQGSGFVTQRASEFLAGHLQGSEYGSPEDIATMTKYFDNVTKLSFVDPSKSCFIRFGRSRDNEPGFNIRCGTLKLRGDQVVGFFEPTVNAIVDCIEDRCSQAHTPIKAVCLVGHFATSPYLCSMLHEHFNGRNIPVFRPDGYLDRAVVDGAVYSYLDKIYHLQ